MISEQSGLKVVALVTEDDNFDIVDVPTIELKYPMLSPDVDEIIWQLPHICPSDVGVYIDLSNVAVIDSEFTKSITDVWSVVLTKPQFADDKYDDTQIIQVNPACILFNKSESSYNFFNWVQKIGRNWKDIAIGALPEQLRIKRTETVLGLAYVCTFPARTEPPLLQGVYDASTVITLGNKLIVSGKLVAPFYV